MRAFLLGWLRLSAAIVASGLLLLPMFFLGAWGAYYILQCAYLLTAPGVPVRFAYTGAEGQVMVQADAYFLDLANQSVIVRGLQVREGDEKAPVAFVERLEVRWDRPVVRVGVRRAWAKVERTGDRSFSFQRLLPPEREPAEAVPYVVKIEELSVDFRDSFGAPALDQHAIINFLRIEGSGQTFLARAEVELTGIGALPIQANADQAGTLAFSTTLQGASIAKLIPHLERWVDLETLNPYRPISADRIVATGPVSIRIPRRADAQFAARLSGNISGANVRGWVSNGDIQYSGELHGSDARLRFALSESQREFHYQGNLSFAGGFSAAGNVVASADRPASLWKALAELVPPEISFRRAHFDGAVSVSSGKSQVGGRVKANSLTVQGEHFRNADFMVLLRPEGVVATRARALWNSERIAGAIALRFATGKLSGFAESANIDVAHLARRFDTEGIGGSGAIQAIFGGTSKRPLVELATTGSAWLDRSDHGRTELGKFDGRGTLQGSQFAVHRFSVAGPNGAAYLEGKFNLTTQSVALNAVAGGLELNAWNSELGGLAFGSASLTGTLKNPEYSGKAQVYAAKYDDKEIPIVYVVFSGDRDRVLARDAVALVGASAVRGSATIDLSNNAIEGVFSAHGISIGDWLGDEFAGLAQADRIVVSGTLSDPVVRADVLAKEFLLSGTSIDEFRAKVSYKDDQLSLDSASVRIGEGIVELGGSYHFARELGSVTARFGALPLQRINITDRDLSFAGELQGDIALTIGPNGPTKGAGNLSFVDLGINGESIGDGNASVTLDEKVWSGSAEIGGVNPPRFISISDARYAIETNAIEGRVQALGIALRDVVRAVGKITKDLPPEVQPYVASARGEIAASAIVSGTLEFPEIRAESLLLSELMIAGRDAGSIEASGSWKTGFWEISSLLWTSEEQRLSAKGTVDESGPINVEGELFNFELSWLDLLTSSLSSYVGKADMSFVANGATVNPQVLASLSVKDFGYLRAEGTKQTLPLSASLDTIEIIDKQFRAAGAIAYEDFSGTIDASGPLESLGGKREGLEPIVAKLELRERNLQEFTNVLQWMDPARTAGTIAGQLVYRGFFDDYTVDGGVELRGASLAAKGVDTFFINLTGSLGIRKDRATLAVSGKSSSGGSIAIDVSGELPRTLEGLNSIEDVLASIGLSGSLQADGFAVVQDARDRSKRMMGKATGQLDIRGSLLAPVIGGMPDAPIRLAGVDVNVPTEFRQQEAQATPLIDPRFESIRIVTSDPAVVKTSNVDLVLQMSASLTGTLSVPDLLATMEVQSGRLTLPTSRIRLEPGGSLRFAYLASQSSDPSARLDVNLEGNTFVSALKYSDTVERYRIDLEITGNILEEGGLVLRATSDPPGLSQDEILALIGQASLIASLTDTALTRRFGSGFREAIYTLAIPNLLNPVTERIAYNLGLDYLNIEYNAFDKATVVAAKSLGHGFTLFGRRQLFDPTTGKQKYELKLTYRIPVRTSEFARLAVGIGFDQDRPWKLTLDYSKRFFGF